jgi:hypothetical protein
VRRSIALVLRNFGFDLPANGQICRVYKKPVQYVGKEFVFRGLLEFATTGKTGTADAKKRKCKNGYSIR